MTATRRTLLQRGSLLAAAAAWPHWMPRMVFRQAGAEPVGDTLVCVFARGGYDGLNMIIPLLDEANYYRLRPTIGIPAPDSSAARKAVALNDDFAMHPTLAENGWKDWFDAGILGMVHAMHMDDPTRSHFAAMDYMERGTPGSKSERRGWLGRHLQTMATQNESPFRGVGMGTMLQASLRGPVPAVTLQSIAEFHLQGRQAEIARFQQHLQDLYGGDEWLEGEGQSTFAAIEMLEQSVGGGTYVPENGADYSPGGAFGEGLKQVAQLVKSDVGLEVACIDNGGWDTHANEVDRDDPTTGNLATLMARLSSGITAFVKDLGDRFDPTDTTHRGVTLVVMSEFGRRAFENGGVGTDHGHGNVMYLFGKGINGGTVYTNPWPGLNDEQLDRGDLAGTTEYRDILGEIVEKRLGNTALDQVFPNFAFNYLGLAKPLDVTVPTATVTGGTPVVTPTSETPGTPTPPVDLVGELHLPWAGK